MWLLARSVPQCCLDTVCMIRSGLLDFRQKKINQINMFGKKSAFMLRFSTQLVIENGFPTLLGLEASSSDL